MHCHGRDAQEGGVASILALALVAKAHHAPWCEMREGEIAPNFSISIYCLVPLFYVVSITLCLAKFLKLAS